MRVSNDEGIFHARSAFHKFRKEFISLKKAPVFTGAFFLAYPTGFEPATLRVGVSRAIQLCHG